jgi:hypothetical protein
VPPSSALPYADGLSVESQGRTLEQLEWVYSQPNPVKASLKVDKVIVREDGKVEGLAEE